MRSLPLKIVLLCALCALVLPAAPAAAASKIFYGFHPDFAPFSFLEDGQPAGFEVELLQAALQGSDYDLQLRPMAWDNILVSLNTGGVHVTSGMARTPQREQAYIFTRHPSIALFTRIFQNTRGTIQSFQELKGAKASVKRDSLYQYDLENLNLFDIRLYDSQMQAMQALWADETELFCTADKIGYYLAKTFNFSGVSATGEPLRTTFLFFALRRDQHKLRDALDRGLERLWNSGAFDRIYRRWFVPEISQREVDKLREVASEGADRSYVPYSLEPRGAAVLTRSGRYYAGGRIENGETKLSRSALTVALQQAASAGDTDIIAAASLSSDGRAVPPTADERRLLYEFGRGVLVLLEPDAGENVLRMISELLPYPEQFSAWSRKLRGF